MTGMIESDDTGYPGLVLAHPDPAFAATVARWFRQRSWHVHPAHGSDDVRRLARLHHPDLIVLAAEGGLESGWMTCDKLTRELPGVRVALVARRPTWRQERFAAFVGAAALVDALKVPTALGELADAVAVA